jgi:hypothetical protein
MTDLTLIYGAVDRVDCAITALGAVMMDLDDDPEREDRTEVAAIRWLYGVLRDEAHNVRGYMELLDKGLNGGQPALKSPIGGLARAEVPKP